jgi:hypothetical protein
MKTRRAIPVLSSVALAFVCSGCPMTFWSVAETDGTLEDSMRTYTKMVRWGEFDRAALFVRPELRERFIELGREVEGIRFTEYDVGPVTFDDEADVARVTVVYHAYDETTLVEQVIREEQTWKNEGPRSWTVEPGFEGFAALRRRDRSG